MSSILLAQTVDLVGELRGLAVIVGRDAFEHRDAFLEPADLADEIEWIIVDHDSADDSAEVCESFRARGLQVRFVRRRGNYSFSESNNYGVRYATGDILLFANNDLLFPQTKAVPA